MFHSRHDSIPFIKCHCSAKVPTRLPVIRVKFMNENKKPLLSFSFWSQVMQKKSVQIFMPRKFFAFSDQKRKIQFFITKKQKVEREDTNPK